MLASVFMYVKLTTIITINPFSCTGQEGNEKALRKSSASSLCTRIVHSANCNRPGTADLLPTLLACIPSITENMFFHQLVYIKIHTAKVHWKTYGFKLYLLNKFHTLTIKLPVRGMAAYSCFYVMMPFVQEHTNVYAIPRLDTPMPLGNIKEFLGE